MSIVFACIGALVAVGAVGIALLILFGWAVDSAKNFYVHLCYKAEELTRRNVGIRLMQESHWYSEDEAVMAALEIIGRNMSKGNFHDISQCRDEWRSRKGKSR